MTEPSQSDSRFSVSARPMSVQRVEVLTPVVDHNYARVELSIDGIEFELSGPDAQVVGATLNTAGGGDMYAKSRTEDDLIVKNRQLQDALHNLVEAVKEERRWATGTETHTKAQSALYVLAEKLDA